MSMSSLRLCNRHASAPEETAVAGQKHPGPQASVAGITHMHLFDAADGSKYTEYE